MHYSETKKLYRDAALWGVILVIVIIAVAMSGRAKKINVEDYVTITYSGINGYANAYVTLDRNGLYLAVLEATGKKADYDDINSISALGSALQDDFEISACIDKIELSTSQESNLSNGDTIEVEISYDNDLAKKQKIKFTGSSVTLKVENLEDAVPVDPFEGLEVSFSGISPNGSVNYSYNGSNSNVYQYSFSAEPLYNLKNGDIVTITYSFNELEAQSAGYVITNSQMEYEVSGLDEYVQAYADITEDFLETIKSEANDKIKAYSASNYYNSGSTLNDLSYAGYILNTPKEGSGNQLYLIYSGNVSNTSGAFPATKVYYPVMFSDIMRQDGELSYNMNSNILGSSQLGGRYSTNGYVNPVLCYVDLVEKYLDSYNCECGDGFEVFAEFEHVTKLSDIDDSYKQILYQDARDTVESYIANSYNGGSTASGLAVAGEYLLVAKNLGYLFENNNSYIVVYSAQVSNENGYFEPTTVYYPVLYKGIVHLPNGEYMMSKSEGLQGSIVKFPDSYYETRGYIDGQAMYNDLILRQVENYTYEVSESLKQFGQ